MTQPTPEEIRAARKAAGLTQTQAGAVLHTTVRTWQQWEAGDRAMHAAFWELFKMKVAGQGDCKMMPLEPTQAMLDAAWKCGDYKNSIAPDPYYSYRAMIAAAP